MATNNEAVSARNLLHKFLEVKETLVATEKELRNELLKIDNNLAELEEIRKSILEALGSTPSESHNGPVKAVKDNVVVSDAPEPVEAVVEPVSESLPETVEKVDKPVKKTKKPVVKETNVQDEWDSLLDGIDLDNDDSNVDLDEIQF